MRASSSRDRLRASDAERDQAIGELRHRFAEGRLSQDTFLGRMDAALRAKNRHELSDLFADLPADDEQEARRPGQAALAWLAHLWQAARDRLGSAGHHDRASGSLAAVPESAWPFAPPSQGPADYAGHGNFVTIPEPQSLCLPPLTDRKFTIGRAPSCDFTVTDVTVSRWHARLHREDDSWLLSDLGSTNGTRLNGWRVTSAVPVQPGDQVTFGSAAYVITDRPVVAGRPEAAAR